MSTIRGHTTRFQYVPFPKKCNGKGNNRKARRAQAVLDRKNQLPEPEPKPELEFDMEFFRALDRTPNSVLVTAKEILTFIKECKDRVLADKLERAIQNQETLTVVVSDNKIVRLDARSQND